jgi:mannose-6-phosphate isomerase
MNQVPLYPLRFEPIYQYRLWGGRRLADLLAAPLPEGPVGEAWLLSDRDDHSSVISNGLLKGRTLGQLLKERPKAVLGQWAGEVSRFPLLLKFLDVQGALPHLCGLGAQYQDRHHAPGTRKRNIGGSARVLQP